jgi:Ti-type conjugative transfer relaxase TraA
VAIYHFSAKVISRANGSSAVAAAAYRSASRLHDERLGRDHDFSNKAGVIHSEVLIPEAAPERWRDRQVLWNEVEALEKRKDAQLAREVEFAIPRELSQAQGVDLARGFIQREFVSRGMVADFNVHWDRDADGEAKPHAHVMLSMREAGPDGFGAKARAWNERKLLERWREDWAAHVNERLAELGIGARVDHRSLKAQGIELEPQHKIGPVGARREARGEGAERAVEHREIAQRNGARIIAEPSLALDAVTRQQSTFTDHDLMRFVHRHTDDAAQFAKALSAVRTAPDLVALGKDGRGRDRFTTREMLATEQRMERTAEALADRRGHRVSLGARERALVHARTRGLHLGEQQADAMRHVLGSRDLSLVVGYAGSGKSAMLGAAREAWAAHGYRVRGAALSGIAAESLEAGSGIASRTIASLEHAWGQGREELTSKDVLVIDEAGMIGSRQMDRMLAAADRAGAKVVLVGDAEQLQAIEAGAAFRALSERHGAAEINEVRRQREEWQRTATRELATGRTADALNRYEAAGMVRAYATRDDARRALVAGWDTARRESPDASRIILAHTRADVAELNALARTRLREAGELGPEQELKTEPGARAFAAGDRIMFLRNERSLGVKNGSLGTVEAIEGASLAVRLDGADGRQVRFDLKDYAAFDHGYASTIHKSQGVTVDQAHLLATGGLDRHAAYVGMSRHREALAVHYGADDFKDRQDLARTLGRERRKDLTLDYVERPRAAWKGPPSERPLQRSTHEHARDAGVFDRFRLAPAEIRRTGRASDLAAGQDAPQPGLAGRVQDYARAFADIAEIRAQGLPALPHQEVALRRSAEALTRLSPEAKRDLATALARRPKLARELDEPGGLQKLQKAMGAEARVRLDPELRAERFIQDWSALQERQERPGRDRQAARLSAEGLMRRMAIRLQRDPDLAAALDRRRMRLGLGQEAQGFDLARALGRLIGLGPSIER